MNAARPTRTLLATPLLVVALAFLSACGGSDDGSGAGTGLDTSASTSPDADSGASDSAENAPALVRDTVDALLGVAL